MSEWICYVCNQQYPCRFGCDEETSTPEKCPLGLNDPVWLEVKDTNKTYECKLEIAGRREAPKKCQYTGMDQSWKEVEPEQLPEKIKGFVEKAIEETAKKMYDEIIKHPYDFHLPKQPVTDCTRLPKLTTAVFDREDCPEWAKYAAVDEDGEASFFEKIPYQATKICGCFLRDCLEAIIPGKFDPSDWQNSLIERPEKKELRHTPDFLPIRFKKLDPEAKAPYQATPGSAGFDLTAVTKTIDEKMLFHYGTGIAVEIPAGHVGLVFPRSSIYKERMTLTNCVGVIDSDYRGEIKAVFSGNGAGGYKTGDRIAQLVIVPIPAVTFVEAEELTETERGAGGYGSTGK